MQNEPSRARRSKDLPQGVMIVVVILVAGFSIWRFLLGVGLDFLGVGEGNPDRSIFFTFLGIVALVLLTIAIFRIRQDRKAANWPKTTAHIIRSAVETRTTHFAGEPERTFEVPGVEYTFNANGRTWRGARVKLDGENTQDPRAVVARFPAGADVPVFYNPKDPSDCILEHDSSKGVALGCLVLLAILATSFALIKGALALLARVSGSNPPLALMAGFFSFVMLGAFFASKPYLPTDFDDLKEQGGGWIALAVGLGCLFIAARAAGLLH